MLHLSLGDWLVIGGLLILALLGGVSLGGSQRRPSSQTARRR